MNEEIITKPSFILVVDINNISHSINISEITKIKVGEWPKTPSTEAIKDCILIEVNHLYWVPCEEKDNEGLLEFLHSFVIKDFRKKSAPITETFDEKGGIVW